MTTSSTIARKPCPQPSFFDLWKDDRQSVLATMARNLASDLAAGYDYHGASITRQRAEMAEYAAQTRALREQIERQDIRAREAFCRRLLKKSGAIS